MPVNLFLQTVTKKFTQQEKTKWPTKPHPYSRKNSVKPYARKHKSSSNSSRSKPAILIVACYSRTVVASLLKILVQPAAYLDRDFSTTEQILVFQFNKRINKATLLVVCEERSKNLLKRYLMDHSTSVVYHKH